MKNRDNKEKKLRRVIKEQQKVIEVLSDKEIVRGLRSAIEDFRRGRYTILAK